MTGVVRNVVGDDEIEIIEITLDPGADVARVVLVKDYDRPKPQATIRVEDSMGKFHAIEKTPLRHWKETT